MQRLQRVLQQRAVRQRSRLLFLQNTADWLGLTSGLFAQSCATVFTEVSRVASAWITSATRSVEASAVSGGVSLGHMLLAGVLAGKMSYCALLLRGFACVRRRGQVILYRREITLKTTTVVNNVLLSWLK